MNDKSSKTMRILITGASRGIGRETAICLAKKGYDLILVAGKNQTLLSEVKDEIGRISSVKCDVFLCDVGKKEDIEKLKDNIGEVDGIINNAAISYIGLITQMEYGDWEKIIDTNLNSLFYITKAFVPGMINRQNGRIVNISSVWGAVGASMEVAYSATKGGVNAFTRALAKELGPSNIKVNAVAFGVIDTDMNKCLGEEDMDELVSEIPMDRIGNAKEAAEMIATILEAPDYLTGQVITMDGGWI